MILEPDFFEHWKTKALIELTTRPESPLWVMRLWAHCQTRKIWGFRDMTPLRLKVICGATRITAEAWQTALMESQFIGQVGKALLVNDWEKHNIGLLVRWVGDRKIPPSFVEGTSHSQGTQKEAERRPIDVIELIEWIDKMGGSGALQPFKAPSLEEVEAYAVTSEVDPSEARNFHAHFTANGWMQHNGKAVKDWKAKLRYWDGTKDRFVKKNATAAGHEAPVPFDPDLRDAHTGTLPVLNELPEVEEAKK